jgi:hypothetical protein
MGNNGSRIALPTVVVIAAFCCATWFLLHTVLGLSLFGAAAMSVGAFALLLLSARRGLIQLFIALAAGPSIFVSLTCSMGKSYSGDSPL